jgi:hypothetical protein
MCGTEFFDGVVEDATTVQGLCVAPATRSPVGTTLMEV